MKRTCKFWRITWIVIKLFIKVYLNNWKWSKTGIAHRHWIEYSSSAKENQRLKMKEMKKCKGIHKLLVFLPLIHVFLSCKQVLFDMNNAFSSKYAPIVIVLFSISSFLLTKRSIYINFIFIGEKSLRLRDRVSFTFSLIVFSS